MAVNKALFSAVEEAVGLRTLSRGRVSRKQQMNNYMRLARQLCEMFRQYLESAVAMDLLRMPAKTPFTKVMEQKSGLPANGPMLFTGELLSHLEIKRAMFGYSVTFDNLPLSRMEPHPFGLDRPPVSAIAFVKFMEAGSMRVLSPRQIKMMAMFARKNNIPQDTRKNQTQGYLRPRPFFSRAAERFVVRYNGFNRIKLQYRNFVLYVQIPVEVFEAGGEE